MEPQTPRRKRFQIHRSTAAAMIALALVLTWANMRGEKLSGSSTIYESNTSPPVASGYINWEFMTYGWPSHGVLYQPDATQVRYQYIFVDVLVALVLLSAVWFLCEWLIGRRAARK